MPARIMTVDFRGVLDIRQHASGYSQDKKPEVPLTPDGKHLSPKQIRARARRRMKRNEPMSEQEMVHLYQKPIEEWDMEELANGRPRNSKGTFTGPKPKWISAQVHEQAMERYTAAVRTSMRHTTVDALQAIKNIVQNEDVDDKGKPIIPASTKLEASKFLLEHVVGKPTQRIESDISVKLQGLLGQVMVNVNDLQGGSDTEGFHVAHYPGITMPLAELKEEEFDNEPG